VKFLVKTPKDIKSSSGENSANPVTLPRLPLTFCCCRLFRNFLDLFATNQGCQMFYFQTKFPIWVNFGGPLKEKY
jgi:hypothetical protein